MKNSILCLLTIFCVSLCAISCGNKSKTNSATENSEQVDKTGKEYASAYVCPMHCKGSGSDKAGKCPVCKMDYVVNKDHKGHSNHDGHNHDGHDHSGHDHSNHDGHDHGNHDGHNH